MVVSEGFPEEQNWIVISRVTGYKPTRQKRWVFRPESVRFRTEGAEPKPDARSLKTVTSRSV
jgi:hypothetical protein